MGRSGDRNGSGTETAVVVGAVLVALGSIATIATLVPLVTDISPLPTAVYLLCFLAPLGLGVVLVALWRRARSRSARIRSVRDGDTG